MATLAEAAWEQLGFEVEVIAQDVYESLIRDKVANADIYVRDDAGQYYVKSAAESGDYAFDVLGIDLQTYSADGFVALSQFSSNFNGNGVEFVDVRDEDGKLIRTDMIRRSALTGWKNDEYDKLIKEAYETSDEDKRADKLKAAEKILIEEAPVIPVVFNQSFAFVSKELKKLKFDGLGNIVFVDAKLKNYRDYIEKDEE